MASEFQARGEILYASGRRPDGSVGMALVLPALTDCRWWFESLLVHSGVSSATRRKATGADEKKKCTLSGNCAVGLLAVTAANPLLFEGFQAGCQRRRTL